jgi:hypothetical protein
MRVVRGKPLGRAWQSRGRCLRCAAKIAGCRRVRFCSCGGRVAY